MQHEEATRFLLFSAEQKTPAGIRALFDHTIASYLSDDPVFSLAAAGKQTDAYIGSVGMAPDETRGGMQIYWSIHPAYWQQGYGAEAAEALIQYAFDELGFDTLAAYTHPGNIASLRLAQKVGMQYQGKIKLEGADEAGVCYTITKKEYTP